MCFVFVDLVFSLNKRDVMNIFDNLVGGIVFITSQMLI